MELPLAFPKVFAKFTKDQVRLSFKDELILKFETVLHSVAKMKPQIHLVLASFQGVCAASS